MISKIMAVALLGAAVAACSSDSGPKEVGGTWSAPAPAR